ncbi:MAG: type IV pilin N-terminal domain-containing protein [Methanospirillum sp.]|nr:type IV pilin N-terminal domain-containing protein [Methanospirillum sp.]
MNIVCASCKTDNGVMMCPYEKSRDDGVSPVVGVMLMLVVTIIIAAVVSAYSGGLAAGQKKAPTLDATARISNDGYWGGASFFEFKTNSVSDPIPTKDIRMTFTWKAALDPGNTTQIIVTGPNTTAGSISNTHYYSGASGYPVEGILFQSPLGYGAGVNQSTTISSKGPNQNYYPDQMFGNYTLVAGNFMRVTPVNYGVTPDTRFQYTTKAGYYTIDTDVDPIQAVLGKKWLLLRSGDTVHLSIMHIPSGKLIFDKDIIVEG